MMSKSLRVILKLLMILKDAKITKEEAIELVDLIYDRDIPELHKKP